MIHVFEQLTNWRSGFELVIGFFLACALTAQILLTKSNVTAAVGWIGLVWFSPFFGGFAYFVLGINRVQRRAKRMGRLGDRPARTPRSPPDFAPDDPQLEALTRALSFITARPVETGNTFEILHNGDEAYPAMLAAIEAAQVSIGLSSYIMRDDTWGKKFVAALRAAHERGVQVRVIVDGIGSGWIVSPAYEALRKAGVPVDRFMHSPLPWKMSFLNLRTHKKILVLDGKIGFTGGINIADQNVLALHTESPVQDTHFKITGPVVGQLVESFALDWSFVTDERLEGETWFPDLGQSTEGVAARVVTAGPDQDLEKVEFAVLEALACARHTVQIMTPYFLPDERLMSALSMAAMRGVAVDVIVPSRSDHRLVDWASHANVWWFLKDGGRIWRSPAPFRHSKALVIDGHWCLVGSSNWDIRSFRLNFELCVEVYDRGLAQALSALMEQNKGPQLLEAELEAKSIPIRLRNAATRLLLPYL